MQKKSTMVKKNTEKPADLKKQTTKKDTSQIES